MNRKIISIFLVLCLLVTSVAVGSFAVTAANEDNDEALAAAGSQAAQDKIQGAVVLHCFDWSYNNIKNNLPYSPRRIITRAGRIPTDSGGSSTSRPIFRSPTATPGSAQRRS